MQTNQTTTEKQSDQIRLDSEIMTVLRRLEKRSIFGEPLHLKLFSDLSGALYGEMGEVILDFNSLHEFIEKGTRLNRLLEIKQQISYNNDESHF